METAVQWIRYAVIALIVALLGGALGWYFYVRQNQASITATDTARGLHDATPSFGGSTGSNVSNVQAGKEVPVTSESKDDRLWRVDIGPIAGYSFIAGSKRAASSTHLDFVQRANGYVFEADVLGKQVMRLTNTLIPKTYEAIVSPKGGVVLMRTLEGSGITTLLSSFATPESTTTFPQSLGGPTLQSGIRSIALDSDPKGTALFYLSPLKNGSTLGMLSSLSNAKPKQLFSSPIASWNVQMQNGTMYLLLSPSDGLTGYAYTVSGSGALSPVALALPGLMIAPHPSAQSIAFSSSAGGVLSLYAQIKNGAAKLLPVQTIAEKCIWGPGKSLMLYCAVPKSIPQKAFIDSWYQGASHSADSWWQIDTQTGSSTLLYTPADAMDVHSPQIDASGSYIGFINGNDESLWTLRIAK